MTRTLWTDDYLVYASAKDGGSQYLGRVDGCDSPDEAVERWNSKPHKKKASAAVHGVRITTFAGTLTHLIENACPLTLRWIARDKATSENAALGAEIAEELGVKLPAVKSRKKAST